MEANRERTLVGLFVLIAGGLFVGTMAVISGGLSRSTVPYRAYFKFAGGIQPGAPVRYGGMMVGKVQRVRVDPGMAAVGEVPHAIRHVGRLASSAEWRAVRRFERAG